MQEAFELTVGINLPTQNRFKKWTLREEMRFRRDVQTALHSAFRLHDIPMEIVKRQSRKDKWQLTYRLPDNCCFTDVVTCTPHIYRKRGSDQCDAHNFITPVDKLLIDMLVKPKGRKWRGFGLFTDDSPEYFIMEKVSLHQAAVHNCANLVFTAETIPEGLREKI